MSTGVETVKNGLNDRLNSLLLT